MAERTEPASIIPFPAPVTTIAGRVAMARGITDFLGWTEAAERGYLIGYMDAQGGLPSAIASVAEYQAVVERINSSIINT